MLWQCICLLGLYCMLCVVYLQERCSLLGQIQGAREQDAKDMAEKQDRVLRLQEEMLAAENERLHLHREFEQQKEDYQRMHNHLNAQMEDMRKQTAEVNAEKEQVQNALHAVQEEGKRKTTAMAHEVAELSQKLKDVLVDDKNVKEALKKELDNARGEFKVFKEQHARQVQELEQKYEHKKGIFCSIQ